MTNRDACMMRARANMRALARAISSRPRILELKIWRTIRLEGFLGRAIRVLEPEHMTTFGPCARATAGRQEPGRRPGSPKQLCVRALLPAWLVVLVVFRVVPLLLVRQLWVGLVLALQHSVASSKS